MFKFSQLYNPIPEKLYFGRRVVRAIYTGQKEHIKQFEQQQQPAEGN